MLNGLPGAGVKFKSRVPGGSRDVFLPDDDVVGGGDLVEGRGRGGVVVLLEADKGGSEPNRNGC